MRDVCRNPLGIYEKALPSCDSWSQTLGLAKDCGFDFVELSVDESDARLNRLNWSSRQMLTVRAAIAESGVPLRTMCLSGHRRFPFAAEDAKTRKRAWEMWLRAFDLCQELGIRVIQTQGHDVYYEPSTPHTWARYLEALQEVASLATEASVMVGIENADMACVASVDDALELVEHCNSAWLQLYPDIGNIVAHGYDVVEQLRRGDGRLVAVHVKDARVAEFRRVPFGEGIVPFERAFATLESIGYRGPLVIEMWNDGDGNAAGVSRAAAEWVRRRLQEASGRKA